MSSISPFVPAVAFRDDAEKRLRHTYVEPLVRSFFRARGLGVPREVPPVQAITEVDFPQSDGLPFEYFYNVVMQGAEKVEGAIDHTAYTLTFDPALCPHTCESTSVQYGFVALAGQPILYYLLLDLQTLIKKLRQHTDLGPSYEP